MTMIFEPGDIVRVVSRSYKSGLLLGNTGTVVKIFADKDNQISFGVMVDNLTNPQSKEGIFWLDKEDLELVADVKESSKS